MIINSNDIRRLMRQRRWKQKDLVDATGASQASVSRWVNGGVPETAYQSRLAILIGVDSNDERVTNTHGLWFEDFVAGRADNEVDAIKTSLLKQFPGKRRSSNLYLREWLAYRGMKQNELATRMGVADGTVSKLLADGMNVTVAYLDLLANALDVSAVELFQPPPEDRCEAESLSRHRSVAELELNSDGAIQYIRAVLEKTGLTPSALAKAADISSTTITRPLSKPDHPFEISTTTLKKIAQATGMGFGEFFER